MSAAGSKGGADVVTIGDGIRFTPTDANVIGSGGFSKVYKGTLKDGTSCAIKIISKKIFNKPEDYADMKAEVAIMQRLRGSPFVINIYESLEDKDQFVIVLELANGGDVMTRIEELVSRNDHFSEKVASRMFKQMLQAVKHCHDHSVVHRDLKPENFLMADKAADAAIKLTDFGLSALLPSPDALLDEGCGSAFYIAPEILLKRGYSKPVDLFALGVILFIMLSGTVPFGDGTKKETEIFRCIERDPLRFGESWASITHAAKELIAGLLEKDPAKRYTIEQALDHPWVSGDAASDRPIDRSVVDSLLQYNARNKFKRVAVQMVAENLTAKDVQALRAAFMKMDADNSGFLTRTEMVNALRELGVHDKDPDVFRRMVEAMDVDGDNRISWEEFLHASLEAQMVKHQQQIWEAFCAIDKDGSGSITVDELRAVLKDEPTEVIERYIAEYDIDGDKTISYEEFLRMLLPKNLKFRVHKTAA